MRRLSEPGFRARPAAPLAAILQLQDDTGIEGLAPKIPGREASPGSWECTAPVSQVQIGVGFAPTRAPRCCPTSPRLGKILMVRQKGPRGADGPSVHRPPGELERANFPSVCQVVVLKASFFFFRFI